MRNEIELPLLEALSILTCLLLKNTMRITFEMAHACPLTVRRIPTVSFPPKQRKHSQQEW
eukprot:45339-Amphidinium_carterae.1